MKRLYQLTFCIGLLGLTLIGLWTNNFTIEVPADPGDTVKWYWVMANLCMVVGIAVILDRRFAYQGCLVCAAVIFVGSYLLRIVPQFIHSSFIDILNNADGWEVLALIGGVLILADSYQRKKVFVKIGLLTAGLFFVWAGITHFLQEPFVASLIPKYIPFHSFWTYFCGICLIAAGIGFWIPPVRLWAIRLAAIMIFSWCILVHIPLYHSDHSTFHLMEIFEALSISSALALAALSQQALS